MLQHELQRGNSISLPAIGGIKHNAHVPPVLCGVIVEIDVADPRAVGAALYVGIEPFRLLSYHILIPCRQNRIGIIDTAGIPVITVIVHVPIRVVGHGFGVGHHFLIEPKVFKLRHI